MLVTTMRYAHNCRWQHFSWDFNLWPNIAKSFEGWVDMWSVAFIYNPLCEAFGEKWHGSSNFFHCCENYLEFSGFCASGNTLKYFAVFFFCRFLFWMFTLLTETFQTFILMVLLKMRMKRRWLWWCWWWWWCWWCWWWWWWRRLVLIALQLTAGRKRDQSSLTSLYSNALAKCQKHCHHRQNVKIRHFLSQNSRFREVRQRKRHICSVSRLQILSYSAALIFLKSKAKQRDEMSEC